MATKNKSAGASALAAGDEAGVVDTAPAVEVGPGEALEPTDSAVVATEVVTATEAPIAAPELPLVELLPVELVEAAPVQVWPKSAVLRNHSGNSLVEPVTGKFLAAGGSEPIELRDQDHENAVMANVLALSESAGQIGAMALDFV